MFSFFSRKRSAKKYTWKPAVEFSDGRAVITLTTFTCN